MTGEDVAPFARRLIGKVILIVGAASDIGIAIARRCAAEGAIMVCADLDGEAAEALAGQLGNGSIGLACDVTASASVARTMDETRQVFGKLEGLVFNVAAPSQDGTVVELDEARWQYELDTGLTGAFLVGKFAVPLMASSGGGSIVFIGSQFARVAVGQAPAYCAIKAGLVHLAKAMAVDHAEQGIRVNSLSPGAVATRRMLTRYADYRSANKKLGPAHLLGRIGEPEEIGAAAAFLLSPDASFITATDMLVDGGYATR